MTEQAIDFNNIPTIGTSQVGEKTHQEEKVFEKPDVAMFDNAPSDVSMGSFFGKIFIGLIVGLCVVALLFGTLSVLGSVTGINSNNATTTFKLLLAATGFVVQFIGSVALALMYNIFFSKRYYNFGKLFALIFVSSIIFSLFFIIIYVLYDNINDLYTVLGFQVIFGLYASLNLMDFLSQPNYSASSMMGNNLGCILTVVAYIGIRHLIDFSQGTAESTDQFKLKSVFFLAIFPVILSYTLMILGAELRNAIYYKFYEWGNNPFYLPSLNELRENRKKEEAEKAEEEDDVNVEMK